MEQQLPPAYLRPLFKRLPRVVQKSLMWRRDAAGKPLLPRNLEAERIVGRFVQQELRGHHSGARKAPTDLGWLGKTSKCQELEKMKVQLVVSS